MKKLLPILIACTLFMLTAMPVFATNTAVKTTTSDDSCYYVTVIEEHFIDRATKSGTKTTYYKNASGTTLWWVKVTGTFTYNGTTSRCTDSSVSASAPASAWRIANKSASKSGNSATATATAKKYINGEVVATITKSVTLSCSKYGTLS